MLVLWDKGFDGNSLLAAVNATGAQVLGRLRANRRTPVLARLGDGSYLSLIGTEKVRVIDATITVTCADGTVFAGSYRLATTLTDARRYPAAALTALYHQRWEHESAYYALRHTTMSGRVLRSEDPAGVRQEMWALLSLYQALRMMMVDAAESLPGTDPDRCCFTVAIQTARDQVVQAAAVITDPAEPGRLGLIRHRILAHLLPPRRQRVSTRKVKSPMSRYSTRHDDGRPDSSRTITGLDINVRVRRGTGTPLLLAGTLSTHSCTEPVAGHHLQRGSPCSHGSWILPAHPSRGQGPRGLAPATGASGDVTPNPDEMESGPAEAAHGPAPKSRTRTQTELEFRLVERSE